METHTKLVSSSFQSSDVNLCHPSNGLINHRNKGRYLSHTRPPVFHSHSSLYSTFITLKLPPILGPFASPPSQTGWLTILGCFEGASPNSYTGLKHSKHLAKFPYPFTITFCYMLPYSTF